MKKIKTLAVIPARYGSTRLEGKPLISIGGVPLAVRVLNQVKKCASIDRVIVATDDARIEAVIKDSGGEALLTPMSLATGTDRVAYVAKPLAEYDIVLSVQVDDPLVGPDMIDPLVSALMDEPAISLAVLAKEIENACEIASPNIVKMVFDKNMHALYFSRSPIPYARVGRPVYYKHIGPYAYRRDFLLNFASWGASSLEAHESLEMLRVLENGYKIKCIKTARDTIEIDTPQDVEALEDYLQMNEEL